MQLLSQQGHLTQEHSKTISIHHFEVPEGVATLGLRFDYGPRVGTNRATNQRLLDEAFDIFIARRKEQLGDEGVSGVRTTLGIDGRVEGLNNLLNVVLIDPAGQWRGRWDRSPVGESEGTLLLSQKVASRGFLPGAITPGRWTAAIECHGVYGDPVEYEIEVDARAPLSPEAEERLSIPAPKTTTRQKRTGPGWYFGEMHSHTRHSDGKWEVEELAEAVSERGSDFLCLTDHNTMSGHEIERDLPVTMIRGCELTTFHGHHPVYGLQDMVPWHEEGKVLPLGETAPRVRAQNGLVSIAHPFVPGDPICTGCRMRDGLDPKDFDMMEIWYRRWDSPGADNVAAYELWNQYWRDGHRILGVGARDVHGAEQAHPFPGDMPLTAVYATDNTPEAILDGMRAGRIIVTGGPIGDFRLLGGQGSAGIGASFTSTEAPRAAVDITGVDSHLELRILRCGEIIITQTIDADGSYSFDLDAIPGWYRAELWHGKRPRMITNHILWDHAD